MFRRTLLVLVLISSFFPFHTAAAQTGMPVYVVQEGDNLGELGQIFHTPVYQLMSVNNLADGTLLVAGMQLYIPSLEGRMGSVSLVPLGLGDNAHTLARQYGVADEEFAAINYLTQPDALILGSRAVLLDAQSKPQARVPLTSGISDLELAAAHGVNPWTAAVANDLQGKWDLLANDTIYLPAAGGSATEEYLPGVTNLKVTSTRLGQGKTAVFGAGMGEGVALSGSIDGMAIDFLRQPDGSGSAYLGIPRLTQPGIYPLTLTATSLDERPFTFVQNVAIDEVTTYGADYPFTVAPEMIDPAVTGPETDQVNQIVAPVTPQKYWSGPWVQPSPVPDCITSTFGRLRSYNGSDYTYFHGGIDFCGNDTTPVYAAADGVVVFTGELIVRGNATIIDHGQGVYTGYWHQSQFLVSVGDKVKAGQEIGIVGATGRVTGPHLHFEVFVDGAQVDPTEWLAGMYP